MKKKTGAFAAILCALLFVAGCTIPAENSTNQSSENTENLESTYSVSTGVSNFTPELAPLSDPDARCALTSNAKMIETENGYYMLHGDTLVFADKINLENWVLFCNRPDCTHATSSCYAWCYDNIWMFDKALLYAVGRVDNFAKVFTLAADGSSKEEVYVIEQVCKEAGGGTMFTLGGTDKNLSFISCALSSDGACDNSVTILTGNGCKVAYHAVYTETFTKSMFAMSANFPRSIRGDHILMSQIPLDGSADEDTTDWIKRSMDQYFRIVGDGIQRIKLPDTIENCYGAYISGDTMYYYRANDGFYCRDIASGQEGKVMDAAYADARGYSLDGCLMIESTLAVPGWDSDADSVHLRYFDGERWYELDTPGDWTVEYAFRPMAATSDRIFFTVYDSTLPGSERVYALYYIMLGSDEMVHCYDFPSFYNFSG